MSLDMFRHETIVFLLVRMEQAPYLRARLFQQNAVRDVE